MYLLVLKASGASSENPGITKNESANNSADKSVKPVAVAV
jgi:hypothetical protein